MNQRALALKAMEVRLEKELAIERARRGLLNFTRFTKPDYEVNWHHRVVARHLNRIVSGETNRLIICMPPRHGKLCANSTPVFTTQGWTTHGQLQVGDHVFGLDGAPTAIVAVSAPGIADYAVTLTNGERIVCHALHEWTVIDRRKGSNFFATYETKEMADSGVWLGPVGARGGRARYQLPAHSPLQLEPRNLPLSPYVLGAWLGDGSTGKACITHAPTDEAVVTAIEQEGFIKSAQWVHKDTGVVTTAFAGKQYLQRGGPLYHALKDIGVLRNKHIPEAYLNSSFAQRMELMAGLIDTDGHCDRTGRYNFSNTNLRLIENCAELARSLGARAYLASVEPQTSSSGIVGKKTCYRVTFHLPLPVPCRLERKRRHAPGQKRRVAIKSIERVQKQYGKCVQVANEDGLYLVGKQLAPTHNSEMVSVRFPAYILGRQPTAQIIAASYNATLAGKMNRSVQRVIDSPSYRQVFPETQLNGKAIRSTAAGNWLRNTDEFEIVGHGGFYRSAGVGGSATGYGATVGLVDDFCKNRDEANSVTYREKTWDWYTSTFYSRLEKNGAIVICATRWHQDDLIGRLLKQAKENKDADQWELVNLPATCEDPGAQADDPRALGEPLWPNKYTLQRLDRMKATIGSRDWVSLYQQRPAPAEGDVIKKGWWRYWRELPEDIELLVFSADLNFKDNERSDFSVFQVWARSGTNYYLLDQVRERMGWTKQKAVARRIVANYPDYNEFLIEDAANGPALVAEMREAIPAVIPVVPKGSKLTRLEAVSGLIEGGNVFLPDPTLPENQWVDDLISEVAVFPNGAHDDQVDALSMALAQIRARHVEFDFTAGIVDKEPFGAGMRRVG